MTRRPALDGLRALAVLAVVAYHFGGGAGSWVQGGFLGVDVFFVLSGYLITSLLLSEYARTGRIDLAAFWARRARRLMPALVVLLVVVSAWIWWATPPDAYPRRRADLLWTLGYLANWHFIDVSEDYFAAYAAASPLRHAWSLAVEEQFYLLWPALLLGLLYGGRRLVARRRARRDPHQPRVGVLVPVAVVAGVSMAASALMMAVQYDPASPSRAYFGTDGRVQELFAGVLLAVLLARRRRVPTWVARLAAAGLGVVLVSLLTMSDAKAPYYLGGALLVSLATVAVIAEVELHPNGRLARACSWRPAARLGEISYGVYLWHWPIAVAIPVVASHSTGEQASRQLARIGLTFFAATLSWVVVERPLLRSRALRHSARRTAIAVATAVTAVVVTALPSTALPGSLDDQLATSGDQPCAGERIDLLVTCTRPTGSDAVGGRPPRLLLAGDSTARALAPGLDAWAADAGTAWVQAAWKRCTASGLLVLPGSAMDSASTVCHEQARAELSRALDRYRPDTVLVAEFWSHHQPLGVGGKQVLPGTPEHAAALRAGYLGLVDEVARSGGRIVFVELQPPGDSLGTVVAPDRPAGAARPAVPGERFVEPYNAVLRAVAAARPRTASTVSVTDLVCPGGVCAPVQGEQLVRTDGVHLSRGYATWLVPQLLQRAGITP